MRLVASSWRQHGELATWHLGAERQQASWLEAGEQDSESSRTSMPRWRRPAWLEASDRSSESGSEQRTRVLRRSGQYGRRQATRGSEGGSGAKDQLAQRQQTITVGDTWRTLAFH